MKGLLLTACVLTVAVVVSGNKNNNKTPPSSWPWAQQCSIDSPGTIAGREVKTWLVKSLDEVEELCNQILNKISDGIEYLEPHVDRSPMFHLDRVEYFTSMKANVQGHLREVFDSTMASWDNFQSVSELYEKRLGPVSSPHCCLFGMGWKNTYHPYQNMFADMEHMITKIKENHMRTSGILRSVLQEMAVTVKAIVMNSITITMESLKLAELDSEDAKRLFESNLSRIAPNFFGMVMHKLVKQGSDPSNYKQINRNVLGMLGDVYLKFDYLLQEMGDRCYPCGAMQTLFKHFWMSQAHGSVIRIGNMPVFSEGYKKIYQNEEFLSEVTLSLMASFEQSRDMEQN